ncbi:MAG: RluA family pseudouridine synthase [Lentisphaeria bacterium]|nr:RluA family pseudouridine synthase [Lentisphaeria bacterium]NQZ70220.1 RluA family pseudouridine synthase [Lentisphaeria bacterium]
MAQNFKISEDSPLLVFLIAELKDWPRKRVKKCLQMGSVLVNGNSTTQFDYALKPGDSVEVRIEKTSKNKDDELEILFQDRYLIAINKPAGLLSVASADENEPHALSLLRTQLSRPRKAVKLWPVHRLDRETSGVLLFATSRELRESITAEWDSAEKTYMAIVEGCPEPLNGTINQPIRMDQNSYQATVGKHPAAKNAITHYKTEETVKGKSLLEVKIDTGRQHQIRAHLQWLGHPVVGDRRYGTAGGRMGLHALRLDIMHVKTGKRIYFETPAPDEFSALLK